MTSRQPLPASVVPSVKQLGEAFDLIDDCHRAQFVKEFDDAKAYLESGDMTTEEFMAWAYDRAEELTDTPEGQLGINVLTAPDSTRN